MSDDERKLFANTLAESEADRSNLKRRIEALEAELEAVKRERDKAQSLNRIWREAYETGRNEPLVRAAEEHDRAALKQGEDQ